MSSQRSFINAIAIICALLFAAKLAVVLWALNKGFDIVDEGIHLLCFAHPKGNQFMPMFWLMNSMFPDGFFTIANGRLLKIIAELIIAAILLYTYLKIAGKKLSLPVIGFYSLFLFLDIFDRCFEYNEFSYLLSVIILCPLLLILSGKLGSADSPLFKLFLLAAGLLTGLIFAGKFPVVFFDSFLVLAILFSFKRLSIANAFSFLLGLPIMYGISIGVGFDPISFLQTGVAESTILGHNTEIIRFVLEDTFVAETPAIIPLLLVLYAIKKNFSESKLRITVFIALLLHLASAIFVAWLVEDPAFYRTTICISLFMLAVVVVLNFKSLRSGWLNDITYAQKITMVIYLMLPVFLYAGSMSSALEAIPKFILPMGAIISYELIEGSYISRFRKELAIVITVLLTAHFVYYVIINPWGMNGPMYTQTYPAKTATGETVLFDKSTADFFNALNERHHKYNPDTTSTLMVFDIMPGINYWLNVVSPVSGLYNSQTEKGKLYNHFYLTRFIERHYPLPGMIMCIDKPHTDFKTYLDTSAIHFSDNFQLKDSIEYAYENCTTYDPRPKPKQYLYFFARNK